MTPADLATLMVNRGKGPNHLPDTRKMVPQSSPVARSGAISTPAIPKAVGKYGPRHKPGVMNKLEAAYARYLDLQKASHEIIDWRFEGITLIIAEPRHEQRIRMTLDFFVLRNDMTIELVDVKGFQAEDAFIKIKTASGAWPWFTFVLVTRKKGEWIRREV